MGWQDDLKAGADGETSVVSLLNKCGIVAVENTGPKPHRYDLEFTHEGLLIKAEVKNDLFAATSGNVAIEYFNPKQGKPSGIFATEADLWFHIIAGKIFFCLVQDLQFFTDWVKPDKHYQRAGDANAAIKIYRMDNIIGNILIPANKTNLKKQIKILLDVRRADVSQSKSVA